MYVLDSVHLEHHFSLLNYRERVSLARLRNFLMAESAYMDLYGQMVGACSIHAQLAVRLVNQSCEVRRARCGGDRERVAALLAAAAYRMAIAIGGWPDRLAAEGRVAGGASEQTKPAQCALAVVVLYRKTFAHRRRWQA